jgi:hypothetical protein
MYDVTSMGNSNTDQNPNRLEKERCQNTSGKREFPFAALGCFLAFFCLFLPFEV